MKKYLVLGSTLFALPVVASAADLTTVINKVALIIGMLVPIVMSLGVLVFLWGLVNYLMKSGDDRKAGMDIMIWGIVTLFVMVSIWGLVSLLSDTLDLDENAGERIQNPVDSLISQG